MLVKNVFQIPPNRITRGDLGMEFEVEGRNLPFDVAGFITTEDGSLRGESKEYVFKNPASLDRTHSRVKLLCKKLNTAGTRTDISERCGIHVHVNVQELEIKQLWNFVTLYYMYEELLVRYCGPQREGSLFCLRAKDTDWIINYVVEVLQQNPMRLGRAFNTDMLRYSALNFKALTQYGSLEFRSMRGSANYEEIAPWFSILYRLREEAKQFENPLQILEVFNQVGELSFTQRIFGDYYQTFTEGVDYETMLEESIENVEDIAYAIEWGEYGKPSINPFEQGFERPMRAGGFF
jgi:hypothetical protein